MTFSQINNISINCKIEATEYEKAPISLKGVSIILTLLVVAVMMLLPSKVSAEEKVLFMESKKVTDLDATEMDLLKQDGVKINEEGVIDVTEGANLPVDIEEVNVNSASEGSITQRKESIQYRVKVGDVISGIARKFGLETQTVLWANDLDENSIIQIGEKLTIPPRNGLTYEVESGDTISEIADYYECDVDEILAFNDLESKEDIKIGQDLFLPDAEKPEPAPTTYATSENSSTTSTSNTSNNSSSTNYNSSNRNYTPSSCHSFPYGWCTWYVAQKRGCIPWGGDAKSWLYNARSYGYNTGSEPAEGAIMVTTESWWGHVAYVENVQGNMVTVSEMNKVAWGQVSYRTIHKDSWKIRGYIYWKE